MTWELRVAYLWEEDARKVDSLASIAERDNAETARLMDDGWEVAGTAPASSAYAIRLAMRREKTNA
jgi:hypothetical protein